MRRFLSLPVLVALLFGLPSRAQIFVPADQPTLQAAIDAAPAGGTIIVTTPIQQEPVIIDRPVNIVGDPVVNVGDVGHCGGARPAITLAGPGSGIVRVSGAVLWPTTAWPSRRTGSPCRRVSWPAAGSSRSAGSGP